MKNKVYPSIKEAIFLFLVFLVVFYGLRKLRNFLISKYDISNWLLFGSIIWISVIIPYCLVFLIGFKKTNKTFNELFKFNKVPFFLWISATLFIIGFDILIVDFLDNLLLIFPATEKIQNAAKFADQHFILDIIYYVIFAPLFEEMLFRGLIFGSFKENYTYRKAAFISAFFFGLAHFDPYQFIVAFIMGLFSAWLFIRTNSILLSIYLHFYHNFFVVVPYKLRDIVTLPGYNKFSFPLKVIAIAFVLFILGIILLKKGFKVTDTNRTATPCGQTGD